MIAVLTETYSLRVRVYRLVIRELLLLVPSPFCSDLSDLRSCCEIWWWISIALVFCGARVLPQVRSVPLTSVIALLRTLYSEFLLIFQCWP